MVNTTVFNAFTAVSRLVTDDTEEISLLNLSPMVSLLGLLFLRSSRNEYNISNISAVLSKESLYSKRFDAISFNCLSISFDFFLTTSMSPFEMALELWPTTTFRRAD